jgi:hypothetical protein
MALASILLPLRQSQQFTNMIFARDVIVFGGMSKTTNPSGVLDSFTASERSCGLWPGPGAKT